MSLTVPVDISESIVLRAPGIAGATATAVGDPPQWEDGSDATYVEVDGAYYGPGEPQFFASADADLPDQELAGIYRFHSAVKLNLRLRLAGVQAGLPFPRVNLVHVGTGTWLSPAVAPPCPNTPTTVILDMSGGNSSIQSLWNYPGEFRFEVGAAAISPAPGHAPADPAIRSWRIYEVSLAFEVNNQVISARRKFPRSDGHGRGPRRHWPVENTRTGRRHGPESTI